MPFWSLRRDLSICSFTMIFTVPDNLQFYLNLRVYLIEDTLQGTITFQQEHRADDSPFKTFFWLFTLNVKMLTQELRDKPANKKTKLITHCPDNTMLSVHILPWYATNFSVRESNSNTSEKLHLAKLTLVQRNQ